MKEPFLFRFLRDSAFTLAGLWIVYYLFDLHMNVWQGQGLFENFVIGSELLITLMFLFNIEQEEKRQYKFIVEVDGEEYAADEYAINLMEKASHVILNKNEYIAVADMDTLKITQNPNYKGQIKGTAIDLSDILNHAHEFAEECRECEKGMEDPYQGSKSCEGSTEEARTAHNKGKKMSESQKKKISESLKKFNALKKTPVKQSQKTVRNLKK